jgi:hypothetical protein
VETEIRPDVVRTLVFETVQSVLDFVNLYYSDYDQFVYIKKVRNQSFMTWLFIQVHVFTYLLCVYGHISSPFVDRSVFSNFLIQF